MTDFLLASQFLVIWTGLILIICALYVLSRQVALLSKEFHLWVRWPSTIKSLFIRAPTFEKASIEGKVVVVGGIERGTNSFSLLI